MNNLNRIYPWEMEHVFNSSKAFFILFSLTHSIRYCFEKLSLKKQQQTNNPTLNGYLVKS